MNTPAETAPWTDPAWRVTAEAWIRHQLDRHQLVLTGTVEQPHVQPWSTVLHVPTSGGTLFFKASALVLGHEAALTAWLAARRPDCIPELLALDEGRNWLLMTDGGTPLRQVIRQERSLTRWHTVLPLYAGLQLEMQTETAALQALGIFDRRLAVLPAGYARLLDDVAGLLIGTEDGLSVAEFERLQALDGPFAQMCAGLAAAGIGETLHHDDFHDANVFVRGSRYTIADWGESCLAHPFFSLVVTLRSIASQHDLAEDGPEIAALRDSYLRPWTVFAPLDVLIETFRVAYRVGMISRALTWRQFLDSLEPAARADYAHAVPAYLQEFLTAVDRHRP